MLLVTVVLVTAIDVPPTVMTDVWVTSGVVRPTVVSVVTLSAITAFVVRVTAGVA